MKYLQIKDSLFISITMPKSSVDVDRYNSINHTVILFSAGTYALIPACTKAFECLKKIYIFSNMLQD